MLKSKRKIGHYPDWYVESLMKQIQPKEEDVRFAEEKAKEFITTFQERGIEDRRIVAHFVSLATEPWKSEEAKGSKFIF